MNTYRVKVRTELTETFEIDAETEEQAATDWFDGTVVYSDSGEPEVQAVTWIDRTESNNPWVADKAAGAL